MGSPCARAGRHGHASGLAQLQGAGRVFGRKNLLNGGLLRAQTGKNAVQIPVNFSQPVAKFAARRRSAHHAAIHQSQNAGNFVDHAPARALRAGVYADDRYWAAERYGLHARLRAKRR